MGRGRERSGRRRWSIRRNKLAFPLVATRVGKTWFGHGTTPCILCVQTLLQRIELIHINGRKTRDQVHIMIPAFVANDIPQREQVSQLSSSSVNQLITKRLTDDFVHSPLLCSGGHVFEEFMMLVFQVRALTGNRNFPQLKSRVPWKRVKRERFWGNQVGHSLHFRWRVAS